MTTELVSFPAQSTAVELAGKGYSGARLMTAAEFKKSNGVKGNEGRRLFNEYLKKCGKVNTANLAGALTTGDLLVTRYADYEKSGKMAVTFQRVSKLKDPVAKTAAPAVTDTALDRIVAAGLAANRAEAKAWLAAK